MPYIQARLGINLDDTQRNELQAKLTDLVSAGLSKPKTYIMTEIIDNSNLYMAGGEAKDGAYISIKLLGSTNKAVCTPLTGSITKCLSNDYGLNPSKIYITYHPVDLWGWNDMMF